MHTIDRRVIQTTLATAFLIGGMYWLAPDYPGASQPIHTTAQTPPPDLDIQSTQASALQPQAAAPSS